MSFFTVRMKRKQIVTKYDARGKVIEQTELLIDQVYHDLPYSTAMSYKTRFPDNQVVIEAQPREMRRDPRVKLASERESKVPRADRKKIGGSGTKIAHTEAIKRKAKPAPSPALGGGDLTDALNRVLEKA